MRNSTRSGLVVCLALMLLATSCGGAADSADNSSTDNSQPATDSASETSSVEAAPSGTAKTFAESPNVPTGDLSAPVVDALDAVVAGFELRVEPEAISTIGGSQDVRLAWVVSDLMRFSGDPLLPNAAQQLTGLPNPTWGSLTDHLIAWDTPAPPNYAVWKGGIFSVIDERWAFIFNDPNAATDFRYVSWGGVFIDHRELGDTRRCTRGCIPALDDPAVTPASQGNWYPDDALVFGVVINDEARAYPKNQMEVHEMVNDTLGGRRIAMPYCTLCLSAQVWLTDQLPEGTGPLVFRTSGLLSRSNKVMYELNTQSVFDTFAGVAVSGPLHDAALELEQVSVITSTWGEWKLAHPDTTIVAEDGGLGRTYELDPLGGRDDDGPIFPVGDVDPRLTVHERVLTVLASDGTPVAFPVGTVRLALLADQAVTLEGVTVVADGGGFRAQIDGADVASHEAFWFAWSQFHPDTLLWQP